MTTQTSTDTRQRLERFLGFLQHDPGNPELNAEVAELYLQLGEAGKARAILEPLVEGYPQNTRLQFRLATAHMASGEPERAIVILQTLLAASPDDPAIRYNLGYALLLQRRYQEAKTILMPIPEQSNEAPTAAILLACTQGSRHKPGNGRSWRGLRDISRGRRYQRNGCH